MPTYTKSQEAALVVLRLMVAAIFLYAGYAKLPLWSGETFGMSGFLLNLSKFLAIAEPLGALAILGGFLTRWAAAGLSIIMVGAILLMQFMMKISFSTPTGPGWDFPLIILGGCLILLTFGAGRYSIDAKIGK